MADEPTTAPVEGEQTEPQTETPPEPQASESPKQPDIPVEVKRALAKANKEAESLRLKLKEIEDRDLSELEKARRDAQEASSRLADYERTNTRQRVALEKGIPAALVARLQGSTVEEISADADELLALLKAPVSPRPDPGQGARPSTPEADAQAEYEKYFPPIPTRK